MSKRGIEVAVIAPSLPVAHPRWLTWSENLLADHGIAVARGPNLLRRGDRSAGSLEHRREDLLWAITNYHYVWMAYGGYAADDLLSTFRQCIPLIRDNNTQIIGYSDVETFTNPLFAHCLTSVFGCNFGWFWGWNTDTQKEMIANLHGKPLKGLPRHAEWVLTKSTIPGRAEGRLLASGITTLTESFGKKDDPLAKGSDPIILLLDDNDDPLSDMVRHLNRLRDHPKFEARVKGVVVGRLPGSKEVGHKAWAKKTTKYKEIVKALGDRPIGFVNDTGHAGDYARRPIAFRPVQKGAVHRLTIGPSGKNSSLVNLEA